MIGREIEDLEIFFHSSNLCIILESDCCANVPIALSLRNELLRGREWLFHLTRFHDIIVHSTIADVFASSLSASHLQSKDG